MTPAGVVSTVAGAPTQLGNVDDTGAAARFNFPNDIAVDAAGNLYVADFANYSIRKGVPAAAAPTSAISNISVRATLSAGQTLIMGFAMQGGAKPVLLRAIGPGLAAFGVPGTMADPRLALFQGQTQLEANDNWGGGAPLANTEALMADLAKAGLRCVTEKKEGAISRDDLVHADAVFLQSPLTHQDVTFEHNALRDCLYASSLPRHVKTSWFRASRGPRPIEKR